MLKPKNTIGNQFILDIIPNKHNILFLPSLSKSTRLSPSISPTSLWLIDVSLRSIPNYIECEFKKSLINFYLKIQFLKNNHPRIHSWKTFFSY